MVIKKEISKLHYITQEIPGKAHWQLAEQACKAGVEWVQLRLKNKTDVECLDIATKTLTVCRKYGSKLIINDHVDIAKESKADGVHLGKLDMEITKARKILGDNAIIGGTANTIDDIRKLFRAGADYIGLGPYRFTTTKQKLSPVLGIEGYGNILNVCALEKINSPIIAIGGILPEDVAPILETGIYGVAVASSIALADDMRSTVKEFLGLL